MHLLSSAFPFPADALCNYSLRLLLVMSSDSNAAAGSSADLVPPQLLRLEPYESPILRERMPAVVFPLSASDRTLVRSMCHSIQPASLALAGAPWPSAVGMAANQWGQRKRIFLFAPTGNVATEEDGKLRVIFNPEYEVLSASEANATTTPGAATGAAQPQPQQPQSDEMWEGCFSVPMARGLVRRPLCIRARWQDASGAAHQTDLCGWPARVWQHENEHLNGRLYDADTPGHSCCVQKRTFASQEEADEFGRFVAKERAQKRAAEEAAAAAAKAKPSSV
jgi:peptide deformylase